MSGRDAETITGSGAASAAGSGAGTTARTGMKSAAAAAAAANEPVTFAGIVATMRANLLHADSTRISNVDLSRANTVGMLAAGDRGIAAVAMWPPLTSTTATSLLRRAAALFTVITTQQRITAQIDDGIVIMVAAVDAIGCAIAAGSVKLSASEFGDVYVTAINQSDIIDKAGAIAAINAMLTVASRGDIAALGVLQYILAAFATAKYNKAKAPNADGSSLGNLLRISFVCEMLAEPDQVRTHIPLAYDSVARLFNECGESALASLLASKNSRSRRVSRRFEDAVETTIPVLYSACTAWGVKLGEAVRDAVAEATGGQSAVAPFRFVQNTSIYNAMLVTADRLPEQWKLKAHGNLGHTPVDQ